MPAPKGHKRYGGRTKGTPNKRKLAFTERYDELVAKFADPLEVMFMLLLEDEPSVRLQSAKELLGYMYAKRKTLEVSSPESSALEVNLSDHSGLVEAFKNALPKFAKEQA